MNQFTALYNRPATPQPTPPLNRPTTSNPVPTLFRLYHGEVGGKLEDCAQSLFVLNRTTTTAGKMYIMSLKTGPGKGAFGYPPHLTEARHREVTWGRPDDGFSTKVVVLDFDIVHKSLLRAPGDLAKLHPEHRRMSTMLVREAFGDRDINDLAGEQHIGAYLLYIEPMFPEMDFSKASNNGPPQGYYSTGVSELERLEGILGDVLQGICDRVHVSKVDEWRARSKGMSQMWVSKALERFNARKAPAGWTKWLPVRNAPCAPSVLQ